MRSFPKKKRLPTKLNYSKGRENRTLVSKRNKSVEPLTTYVNPN